MSAERESSLDRFRKLTEDMKAKVHADAVDELNNQAKTLADAIQSVAPIYEGPPVAGVEPGALKTSVNVRPDPSGKDTVVRVVAGGYLTLRTKGGPAFDYARADEFGTQKMPAKPFFFPTYRLMKKKIIAQMKRRIAKRIKQYSAEPGASSV